MPVLKVYKNGIWEEVGNSSPHPNSGVLNVKIDWNNNTCSHSASEIIEAINSGITVIVDGYTGFAVDDLDYEYVTVTFKNTYLWYDGEIADGYLTIYEDKTFSEEYDYSKHAVNVVTVNTNNVASMNSEDIDNIIWYNGVVVLYYYGAVFDFSHFYYDSDADNYYAYFISKQSDGITNASIVVTVDVSGNVSVVNNVMQPMIPVPEWSDVGKVLVAGSDMQVHWEDTNTSGKTLTEHLMEEDLVLSSRQYGDKLPGEDGEPYEHVPGRIFFLKKEG